MRLWLSAFVLALGLWVSGIGLAAGRSVPALTGAVVDEAGIFTNTERMELDNALRSFFEINGIQLQLLTVSSLQGEPIEGFSIRVTDAWKLGDKKTDRGLLLLVAPNDRQVRIEVGQGLEGQMTDAMSGRIIGQTILPYFRSKDLKGGVIAGLQEIAHVLGSELVLQSHPRDPLAGIPNQQPPQHPPSWFMMIFLVSLMFFFMPGLLSWLLFGLGMRSAGNLFKGGSSSGRSSWGGGGWSSGGSSSWSGGGGGFSGGGASGRW